MDSVIAAEHLPLPSGDLDHRLIDMPFLCNDGNSYNDLASWGIQAGSKWYSDSSSRRSSK